MARSSTKVKKCSSLVPWRIVQMARLMDSTSELQFS